ncbi:hypothetical protein AB835_03150 [Candidatus Endobugula sertula]|uniref:DUF2170 domain-containing protein n=1 Tax=Candidatus Endobugula sertula TaxID=62101 RepID=A0A1D2QSM6_9GAMM|nr:hypothetical protein AB835_03150 [Candidatus Endobugula sertula]
MNLQDLSLHFSDFNLEGYSFDCQLIAGEVDVLQVMIEGFEEVPIYISTTDTQILCIAYLWSESEVAKDTRTEMLEAMLDMNIPMPLSSFSRIQDQYAVFGALATNSRLEDIAHEVITLGENAVEVLSMMSGFLK